MTRHPILAKISAGATVLDVRSPGEFATGAYPGALNIPVKDLADRLGDVGPKDKPVIVYCASGGRSALAEQFLRSQGFLDVTNAGGLDEMPRS